LAASYGPVTWVPSFFDRDHQTNTNSMYTRVSLADSAAFQHPTAMTLHSAPDDWRTIFEEDGPGGVSHVLTLLLLRLDGKVPPPEFQSSHQLAIATLWQQTLRCVGAHRECDLEPPRHIDSQRLLDFHSTKTTS
jgi:yersiniabactin synthetase, thiazolinyl reductase component